MGVRKKQPSRDTKNPDWRAGGWENNALQKAQSNPHVQGHGKEGTKGGMLPLCENNEKTITTTSNKELVSA